MSIVLSVVASLVFTAPDAGVPIKAAMQGGFEALTTLVWLTSGAAPKPLQADAIGVELKKLEALPHAFDGAKGSQEPGAAAIASLFTRYVTHTRARFEAGESQTVGHRVRTLAGLCFACHTRAPSPADFTDRERRFDQLDLSLLERAQVQAATRQFDLALEGYRAVLKERPPSPDFARALDDTLTILVRVKGDAAATAAVLDEVARRDDLREATRGAVAAWQRDVKAWQREPFDVRKASADALLTRAQALMKQGGEVPLLRASAAASRALSVSPAHRRRGEALLLLGEASARLRSPLLWDLDLLYFEACVRENPRTPLAHTCFERLQERVTLGFTGSSGTHIPADEQERLETLRSMSGEQ